MVRLQSNFLTQGSCSENEKKTSIFYRSVIMKKNNSKTVTNNCFWTAEESSIKVRIMISVVLLDKNHEK